MSYAVHVHVVDITRSPFLAAELTDELSGDERQRADRLKVADKRAQFICARATLRRLLARHCGQPARELVFDCNEQGKPALRDGDWQFNLSHSHRRMVLACSQDGPLGVDVEYIDPSVEFENLARRFFAVDEFRAVMLHNDGEARRSFYSCWCAKEAFLKCLGSGIDRPLDSFVISQLQHLGANPRRVHGFDGPYDEYIHQLDAGRDYWASLCCADEAPELSCTQHELAQLFA